MLSELRVKTSGENTVPVPFVNCIGMVLPLYSIGPNVADGTVYTKSVRLNTSMYPPTPSTEKFVPNVSDLSTDCTPFSCSELIGFLYGNVDIYYNY